MKKAIIIALSMLTISLMGQSVSIYEVSPLVVCQEDSITAKLTWTGAAGSTIFTLTSGPNSKTWNIPNYQLYSAKKTVIGNDTLYWLKFQIPSDFNSGSASFGISASNSFNLTIGCGVGIKEYELNSSKNYKYYTVYGVESDIVHGQLMIRSDGKKVLIIE